ncbi:hypothetical protein BRC93_12245 [Halobacteriales archaeon QS_5_70_15]|nr:MAG: hypothetical protein BRC93_12245 [Halobacteriales archaeon QS_5_70_15]
MTGIAIIVPFVITVYILDAALDFVAGALQPFVDLLKWLGMIEAFQRINAIKFLIRIDVYSRVIGFLGELFALIVLLGIIVVVGSLGQHRYGERLIGYIDLAVSAIPGIGTVYKSFRRMGDVMLDDTSENFEEVRLVRCLGEDIYMLGFETGQPPEAAVDATGHEDMVTMFLPLAPNPVTGGYLTYVPRSQVYDVDITIEEGVRSILTSGVAADDQAAMIPDDHAFSEIDRLQDVVPRADSVAPQEDDRTPSEDDPEDVVPGSESVAPNEDDRTPE